MITPEQLRAALQAEPFQELKFLRPDGQGYAIASRPDEVAYDGGPSAVVTFPGDSTAVVDLATWGLELMTPRPRLRSYPIDRVREHHEFLNFAPDDPEATQRLEVSLGDRVVTVLVPCLYDYPIDAVLHAAAVGDIMYLVARYSEPFEPYSGPLGLVVVAVRHGEGTYRAVVAHVTYPHALEALGLEPSPGPPPSA
jgi:hypothetical protein